MSEILSIGNDILNINGDWLTPLYLQPYIDPSYGLLYMSHFNKDCYPNSGSSISFNDNPDFTQIGNATSTFSYPIWKVSPWQIAEARSVDDTRISVNYFKSPMFGGGDYTGGLYQYIDVGLNQSENTTSTLTTTLSFPSGTTIPSTRTESILYHWSRRDSIPYKNGEYKELKIILSGAEFSISQRNVSNNIKYGIEVHFPSNITYDVRMECTNEVKNGIRTLTYALPNIGTTDGLTVRLTIMRDSTGAYYYINNDLFCIAYGLSDVSSPYLTLSNTISNTSTDIFSYEYVTEYMISSKDWSSKNKTKMVFQYTPVDWNMPEHPITLNT